MVMDNVMSDREAFEVFACDMDRDWNITCDLRGDYISAVTSAGWEAWQGRCQALEVKAVAYLDGNDVYFEGQGDINDWIRQNGDPLYTHPASCSEIPNSSDPASRQAIEAEPVGWWNGERSYTHHKGSPVAHFWKKTIPLYTHPASINSEEVWEKAMMAAIGEDGPKSVADAISRLKAGSVPEGWRIDPFNGVSGIGITVIWPDGRGGAHIRTNDPQNSIEQNLLHDLAQALVCGAQPINRPGLGRRKAADIGPVIGVLAQNQHGEVCAVTDLGRCTWLNQDVTGAGVCLCGEVKWQDCPLHGSKQEQAITKAAHYP
jgi:hypothetical protein